MLTHFLRALPKGAPAVLSFIAGSEAVTGSGTSLTVNTPSGAQSGDLLVALKTSTSTSSTFTSPSGWVERFDANGRAISTLDSYDGSTANYTFTFGSSGARIQILCFRSALWGVLGTTSASTTNPVAPSITIDVNNSLWLAFASSTSLGITYATPSGFTDAVTAQTSTVSQKIIINDSVQPTGATSTITFTQTAGTGNGRAIQFSVKPA